MKVEVPMVDWHGQVPIFGVDFHPSGRLATASQDGTIRVRPFLVTRVRPTRLSLHLPFTLPPLSTFLFSLRAQLWQLRRHVHDDQLVLEFLAELEGHDAAVNTIRFSPNGMYLASGAEST
jgi:WD40 repeat protein